jgi:hypothetical protein
MPSIEAEDFQACIIQQTVGVMIRCELRVF